LQEPTAVRPGDEERIRAQIRRWQEKLLDLSRGNPLLGLNRSRVSKLAVITPPSVELYGRLTEGGGMLLPLVTRLRASDDDGTPAEWQVQEGDISFDGEPADLVRRIKRIYDNARTTVEERGVTSLHLTFGVLRWSDPSLGDSVTPLVMLPCQLERTSPSAPLKLSIADEEPRLNPALALYLRDQHRIQLPELPEEPSAGTLSTYLDAVAAAVREVHWTVEPAAWLSTYMYDALVLYQDLASMTPMALNNPIVAAFARAGGEREGSEALGEDLDALPRDQQVVPILPADSSQLAALQYAATGRSVVVHGPPGTGKSQTITSLIADALGRGKKVLFVSAKSAALDVVYRRLAEHGLASFCLQAHSSRSGKAMIINELRRTLEADVQRVDGALKDQFEELIRLRDALNGYIRALHEPVGGLDTTPYEAIGRFAKRRDAADLRFRLPWEDPFLVARAQLADVLDGIGELAVQAEVFDVRETHPWRGARIASAGLVQREEIEADLRTIRISLDAVGAGVRDLSWPDPEELQVSTLVTCRDALAAYAASEALPADWRATNAADLSARADRATELAELAAERDARLAAYGSALDVPLDNGIALLAPAREAFASWTRVFSPAYWQWRSQVRRALHAGSDLSHRALLGYLSDAERARALQGQVASALAELVTGATPDVATLRAVSTQFATAAALRARNLVYVPDPADVTRHAARKLSDLLADAGPFVEALERIRGRWPAGFVNGREPDQADLPALHARLDEVLGALPKMGEWVQLDRTVERLRTLGLAPLVDGLANHSAREAAPIFERRFWAVWASAALERTPVLEAAHGARMEEVRERFAKLGDEMRVSAVRWILAVAGDPAARIRRADPTLGTASEVGILQKELGKQKRFKPLRKLFGEIPHVLQAIKPCMLMSPVSVSTFLRPGSVTFDLVVYDEASQLPTAEAIPSILRAGQVIVAGDAKQLPPTAFFTRIIDAAEEADEGGSAHEPLQSLLNDAVAIRPHFQETDLRWHYRSRDERLIAFSNHEFYDGRLHTFPSATTSAADRGVRLEYVADGVWGRGKDRRNPREARRVAHVVRDLLERMGDRSIGVVAMNLSQTEALRDAIDEELADRPDLQALWSKVGEEQAFVKSLENVQGDERDVMVISVGYGPDLDGNIAMNFGPLNMEGGWRRLNVLVTRAKWQTILVTSLRSGDLVRVSPSNRGATALRNFIAYVEKGGVIPRPQPGITDRETNDFEDAVAEQLISRGLTVERQVGASSFFIDLAIRDRRDPSRFVLGVECDGATYHSSRNAQDRDVLRHTQLRSMGWYIHHLWSTDWFRDPDGAIEKVLRALEYAERTAPADLMPAPGKPFLSLVTADTGPRTRSAAPQSPAAVGRPYEIYRHRGSADRQILLDPLRAADLANQIARIVEVEGPIMEELLLVRLREVTDVGRAGSNVRTNVTNAIERARRQKTVLVVRTGDELVLSSPEGSPETFRTPGDGVARSLEQIPAVEIALGVRHLVGEQVSVQRSRIPSEIAGLFGFDRVRAAGADRIREVIDGMVERGDLIVSGPYVQLSTARPIAAS